MATARESSDDEDDEIRELEREWSDRERQQTAQRVDKLESELKEARRQNAILFDTIGQLLGLQCIQQPDTQSRAQLLQRIAELESRMVGNSTARAGGDERACRT